MLTEMHRRRSVGQTGLGRSEHQAARSGLGTRSVSGVQDSPEEWRTGWPERTAGLQKRRRLVDAKLDTLHREKELLEKMAREQKQEGDVRRDLEEFRALVSDRVQHSSLEDKQKLMRMVLDKVVVRDWRVDVHYNIPLSRPAAPREEKVSTNFDLCNARHHPREIFGDRQIAARHFP